MRTRTYYRGPDAVVTSELFVWRTTPPKVFTIGELRNVGITCTAIDRFRRPTAQTAAGSGALVVAIWPIVGTTATIALIILALAIPGLALAAYWRLRPRLWELHATCKRGEVVLFASTEARVFNQVVRALTRAIEDLPSNQAWPDQAA